MADPLFGWVGVAEFARASGVPPQTMRRRLQALEAMLGVKLLHSRHQPGRKPRKWWVHPERARAALEQDPDAREARLEELYSRLEKLEQKLEALRRAHKSLKKQVFQPGPA